MSFIVNLIINNFSGAIYSVTMPYRLPKMIIEKLMKLNYQPGQIVDIKSLGEYKLII